MDWNECLNNMIAKSVKPDEDMIKSLIKTSENKLESGSKLEMSDVTAGSKISLAYDSLRELLEALALKNGYKIYNHECYKAFLKEVIGESEKGDEYDAIRKIRNAVNYYGKEVSVEDAKDVILKIQNLRNFVFNLMKK